MGERRTRRRPRPLADLPDRGVGDLEAATAPLVDVDAESESRLPSGSVFMPRRSAEEDEIASGPMPERWVSRRRAISREMSSSAVPTSNDATQGDLPLTEVESLQPRSSADPAPSYGSIQPQSTLFVRGPQGDIDGNPVKPGGITTRAVGHIPHTPSHRDNLSQEGRHPSSVGRTRGKRCRLEPGDVQNDGDARSCMSAEQRTRIEIGASGRSLSPEKEENFTDSWRSRGVNASRLMRRNSLPSGTVIIRPASARSTVRRRQLAPGTARLPPASTRGKIRESPLPSGTVVLPFVASREEPEDLDGDVVFVGEERGPASVSQRGVDLPDGKVLASGRGSSMNGESVEVLDNKDGNENLPGDGMALIRSDSCSKAGTPAGTTCDGRDEAKSSAACPAFDKDDCPQSGENAQKLPSNAGDGPETDGTTGGFATPGKDPMVGSSARDENSTGPFVAKGGNDASSSGALPNVEGDSGAMVGVLRTRDEKSDHPSTPGEDEVESGHELYWERTSLTPCVPTEDSATDEEPPYHLRVALSRRAQHSKIQREIAEEENARQVENGILESLFVQAPGDLLMARSCGPDDTDDKGEANTVGLLGFQPAPVHALRLEQVKKFRSRVGRHPQRNSTVRTTNPRSDFVPLAWMSFPDRRTPMFCPPRLSEFRIDRLCAVRRFRKKRLGLARIATKNHGRKKVGNSITPASDKNPAASLAVWASAKNDVPCPCARCNTPAIENAASFSGGGQLRVNWGSISSDEE